MFPALIHYYMSHSLYLYSPPPLVRKLPSTLCHLIFNCPVIKRFLLFGRKVMTNLDSSIKEQRHHFTNKGPSSQSYGFSSNHVWMWELDSKGRRAAKTWWFFFLILFFYFTVLYWFCHTLTWIHHRCTWVPNPEPPPTTLPISSLWVIPVHQPQASCILYRT